MFCVFRYSVNLVDAKKTGVRKSMVSGAGMGVTYFVLFSSYCLAYWFGGKLIRDGEINIGTMLIVNNVQSLNIYSDVKTEIAAKQTYKQSINQSKTNSKGFSSPELYST